MAIDAVTPQTGGEFNRVFPPLRHPRYPAGTLVPPVNGVVDKFNDLPVAYRGQVVQRAPYGQQAGAAPLLSPQDVADLVSFLQTLTDDRNAAPGGLTVKR